MANTVHTSNIRTGWPI